MACFKSRHAIPPSLAHISSSSPIALVLHKLSGAGRALALVLGTLLLLVRSALLRDAQSLFRVWGLGSRV
jgi:hypothetical protein